MVHNNDNEKKNAKKQNKALNIIKLTHIIAQNVAHMIDR